MNSNLRFACISFLTTIYCFAIVVVIKSVTFSDFQGNSNTTQEQYFSEFSTKLFSHTLQSESSVNNTNNLPTPNFKNPFNGIWAITKTTERLFETAYSQYTNISKNFLIQYRKTDIIFPFHYFW